MNIKKYSFLFFLFFQQVSEGDALEESVDHSVQLVPHGFGFAAGGAGACRRTGYGAGCHRQGTLGQLEDAADGVAIRGAVQAVATAFAVNGIHKAGFTQNRHDGF